MPGRDRRHYQGDYAVRAGRVRRSADADPLTRCWRCGELARVDDPWQAGHVFDGDPDSPLMPEHRSCNVRAGVRITHAHRQLPKASRRWR
jgi:hypothetical protein